MNDKHATSVPVNAPEPKKADAPQDVMPAAVQAPSAPAANKVDVPKTAAPAPAQPKAAPVEAAKPAPAPAPAKATPTPAKAAPVQRKPARAKVRAAKPVKARKPVKATTKPKPAAAPVKSIKKGPIMNDTVNKTAETAKKMTQDAQKRTTAMFGDMNDRAKSAMERSSRIFEDMNEFNKGNVEALVESSKVAAKAAETMGQQAAETARKNFENATAAMKSFASVKTPTDFFQLQSEYARNAFDSMMSETSRNSETMLKLAGEVFQPISNRFAVAAEKLKIAA